MLRLLLNAKGTSLYRIEKSANIPHATLNDLWNERTDASKCSSSLLHDLSCALGMTMDALYDVLTYQDLSLLAYDEDFDLFKSNVCQELRNLGHKAFLLQHLKQRTPLEYYKKGLLKESLYMLSMCDYLCLEHHLPLAKEFDQLRSYKLDRLYCSKSIVLLLLSRGAKIADLYNASIQEFLKHNIMEAEIDRVR